MVFNSSSGSSPPPSGSEGSSPPPSSSGSSSSAAFNLTGQLATIWGNRNLFLNWLKGNQSLNLVRTGGEVNHAQARQIIENANKLGIPVDVNPADLAGTEITGQWKGIRHFKVGNVHIPVAPGFIPP